MNRISNLLLAGTLAATFVMPALADSPRDEIEAALASFEEAFNKGDAATVGGHYAEDAAIFPPDSPRIDGRAGIEAFWKGVITAGASELDLKALEVTPGGDYAFEVGEASFSMPGTGGAKAAQSIKYVVVWKNDGGTWRLYRDIWNGSAPAK